MTGGAADLPRGATSAPGAYVHVPFCAHRCAYCSFVALEGRSEENGFFEGVEREIRSWKGGAPRGASAPTGPFDSLYFGGGTPSYVDAPRLGRLLGTFKEIFGLSSDVEITAEANPDDLGGSKIPDLLAAGVNRLSIGVQSLVDAELSPLERRHDGAQAVRAVRAADQGFGNVSADLMIGIPGQTRESLLASVEGLIGAGVSHLSVYLLEIEKAPRLVSLKKARPDLFAGDDETADRWLEVDAALEKAGLPRYELSNWAKPGRESRHNLKYWTQVPVLGFGVAAHSYDGRRRYANTGMLAEYLKRTRAGQSPIVTFEENEEEDFLRREEGEGKGKGNGEAGRAKNREALMLRLRLRDGVPSHSFEEIRRTLPAAAAQQLQDALSAGLLEETLAPASAGAHGGRVRLSRKGVLLSNEVFTALV